jgi:carbon-monoxide dehydrogenase large subunit
LRDVDVGHFDVVSATGVTTADPAGLTRREDARLLAGKGRFVADIEVPGRLDVAFVRPRLAHALLRDVDCARARDAPGVVGAWAAADLPGLPGVPAGLSPKRTIEGRDWPALATGRMRYPGEAVAVVAAADRYLAEDGAALVRVAADRLPAAVDVATALDGSVALFDGTDNIAMTGSAGEPIDEAVWRDADVVVEASYRQQLLVPSPMECRAFLAVPDGDRLTVWASHQAPHRLRRELAAVLDMDAALIRVVVPDVGGAFGAKSATFPEYVCVAHLARLLGQPVRWIEDRAEAMVVSPRGRGQHQRVRLAADARGRMLAFELHIDADVGAYPQLAAGLPMQTALMATGVYTTPQVHATLRSVLTTTMPTYAYRGAGRPEAAYAVERTVDLLATKLDMDPAELRRRNLIPADCFPYDTPTGRRYDSGNYAAALDVALKEVEYDRRRSEQEARRDDPSALPLGIGLCCYVERSGGEPGILHEFGSVAAAADGTVTARCGTMSTGQSHETTFGRLVADVLGVDPARVSLIEGDTAEVPDGIGSFASRSALLGGAALHAAAKAFIRLARERAAKLWGVEDVSWSEGTLCAAGREIGLGELVRETGELRADERFESDAAFPFGAYAAVVEVDPELGTVRVLRLVAVDDYGTVLNPMVVDGQTRGSVAQGLGQALYEGVPFDADGVPVLDNGLLDYLLPTIAEQPDLIMAETCTPTPTTPIGAKGAGEAGCIGVPPAVVNAVANALGVEDPALLTMPLTPDVVWRAAKAVRQA